MVGQNAIYVVDDDEEDRMLISSAFDENKFEGKLFFFENGHKVLEALNNTSNSFPALILLDLNMPGIKGMDLLKQLKQGWATREIPIIVFSTSKNPKEIDEATQHGSHAFFTKPSNFTKMVETIGKIRDFWAGNLISLE